MNTNLPCMTICKDRLILTKFENEFADEGQVQMVLRDNGIIMTKDIKETASKDTLITTYKNNEITDNKTIKRVTAMKYPIDMYFFQVKTLYISGVDKG